MSQRWFLISIALLFAGFAGGQAHDDTRSFSTSEPSTVVVESRDFVLLVAQQTDSYASLADQYLGDPAAAWYVQRFNESTRLQAGDLVVVPRTWMNARGVDRGRVQRIPVLTYHRFRDVNDRLSVSPSKFRAQMKYLRDHGYYAARFQEIEAFIRGEKALPPRTVLIAIDDGYQSAYNVAFPILQEFNLPAVVFIYSDFTNYGGLTTRQMQDMLRSGLIVFEAHSKTHSNLHLKDVNESREAYTQRIRDEVAAPKEKISNLLGTHSSSFAYPYGAVNRIVLNEVQYHGYANAFTVERGTISAFDHPFLLRRSMIYGGFDMDDFVQQLVTAESFEIK